MNEYTPTTEVVRDNYLPPRTEIQDAEKQFDSWLAQVKAQIWNEGFNAGVDEAYEHEAQLQWSMPHTCTKNPYC